MHGPFNSDSNLVCCFGLKNCSGLIKFILLLFMLMYYDLLWITINLSFKSEYCYLISI